MASGRPSSRRQRSTTAAWFESVSSNVPDAAAARSDEQHDRLVLSELAEGLARVRQLERGNRDDVLARNRQRLAAGGDHTDTRRRQDYLSDQLGGGSEHMLAVVDQQQQLLVAQVGEEQGQRLGRRLVPQVKCGQDGVAHQRGILELGQLDQPCPVAEATGEVSPCPDGEPGFANAARARRG